MNAAVLLYHDAAELDLAVSYGVLAATARAGAAAEVFSVGKARGATLVLHGGLVAAPNYSLGSAPEADVLVIPGGPGAARFGADPVVRSFVESRARSDRFVLAIGSGAALLGEAGLLEGLPYPRGANWRGSLDRYRPGDASDEAVVRASRNTFIVASALAAVDAWLAILAEAHGPDAATAVRRELGLRPPVD